MGNPQSKHHSYFLSRQMKIKFDLATQAIAPLAAMLTFPGFPVEKVPAIEEQIKQMKRLIALLQESPARLISVQNQAIPDGSDIAFAAIRFFFEHEAALKALEEAGIEEVESRLKRKKDENKNKPETKKPEEEKKVKFKEDENKSDENNNTENKGEIDKKKKEEDDDEDEEEEEEDLEKIIAREKEELTKVHSMLRSDILSIEADLKQVKDYSLVESIRLQHLSSASATCNRLLDLLLEAAPLFCLTSTRPAAFTPFLLSFIALYVVVAGENFQQNGIASNRRTFLEGVSQLRSFLISVKDGGGAMMAAFDARVAAIRHYFVDEPLYARMGPTSARPVYTAFYDELLRRPVYVDYGFSLPCPDPFCFTEAKRLKRVIVTVEGVDPLPSYLKIKPTDLSGPVKRWYVGAINDRYREYFERGFSALDGLAKVANVNVGGEGGNSNFL